MKTFRHLNNDPSLCDLSKIETEGKRYYVTPNGEKLPSVTTVLSYFNKQGIVEWRKRVGNEEANRISTAASRRGTKFHKLMENYVNNCPLSEDIMPDEQQAFQEMVPLLERIDNIHYVEATLYSHLLGLAGQVDLIAEFDGVLSIIDFKTSSKPKKEEWIENYFLQATAYSLMYEDMCKIKASQIVILISVDNDKPQLFVKERKDYVESLFRRIKEYREKK